MRFTMSLPTSPLAVAVLDAVLGSESEAVANHSIRSYLFAQLLAEHEGMLNHDDYDPELLFAATVMHDLGLGDRAPGQQRFEVEGADLADRLLLEHGVDPGDADLVWEAIALHTSPGIAERRGWLAYLTREGVGLDFGRRADIALAWHEQIHASYPRLNMVTSLVDAIVDHATRSPAAAPRYAIGGELLRERQADGITSMEVAAAQSPWHSTP
jgi:hypothetical protein